MDSELGLGDYVAMLKRRWILIISILVVVISATVATSILLPPVYESAGTILIESQAIPTDLVKGAVSTYADERIESIKQRVMTRDNLIALIDKFKLYSKAKNTMSVTEMIDDIRDKIKIITLSNAKAKQGTDSTIAFKVGVESRYPDEANKIANELVTLFLAENVKSRTSRATETTEFFIEEGERLKHELEEVEKKVATYKEENANSLPEYKDMNMGMVQRLDANIQDLDREYKTTQEELRYLDIELASAKAGIGGRLGEREVVTPESELEKMRSEYTKLIGIYTENHPTVRRLKNKIDMLEKSQAAAPKAVEKKIDIPAVTENALRVEKVEAQITSGKARLESLTAQKNKMKAELSVLQQKIMQAPQVERGLINLLRDYENAKQKYSEIRSKEINAKMTQNLEQDNKGERFTLIEPPAFPEKPIRPDRVKILLVGIFMAFGGAIAVVIGLESMDKRVRGIDALTAIMQMPPLVVLPYIMIDNEIVRKRKIAYYLLIGIAITIVLALVIVHFFYTPLDLLFIKIVSRFG